MTRSDGARRLVEDDEVYVFHSADALKALADPLRLRFLVLLADRASTVKEAADVLGVPPTRLYYHVKILERHGLIRVAGRRMISGIEERTYRAVAKAWTISDTLAASAISTTGVLRALMNMARAEMEAALHERPEEPISTRTSSPLPAIGLTQLAMDEADLAELERRFQGLMEDFGMGRPKRAEGKPLYNMFFAVYPSPQSLPASEPD